MGRQWLVIVKRRHCVRHEYPSNFHYSEQRGMIPSYPPPFSSESGSY
ncbi:hypothetical protein CEV31_3339 [Brucella thiophenivorans]|uniref:Uncharacterized protein n=1 Tax=Brucella thiophenivorans TaxID=571255 RepID=A0A256FEX5_9HYPH|nr:hypothetical protein CEV31_3339 [Brucella thiophenivorans]